MSIDDSLASRTYEDAVLGEIAFLGLQMLLEPTLQCIVLLKLVAEDCTHQNGEFCNATEVILDVWEEVFLWNDFGPGSAGIFPFSNFPWLLKELFAGVRDGFALMRLHLRSLR